MGAKPNFELWVHIIESPSASDIFDAETEGSLLKEALRIAHIPAQYNVVVNSKTFVDALKLFVGRRAQKPNSVPILHLSMHGNAEGVELTDLTFLQWSLLRDVLCAAAEGMLLLCMSSCFGFSACRMAMTEDERLPFLAIVGHQESVALSDVAVGYTAFYHRLFKGAPVPVALEAMKAASGDDRFLVITGEEARKLWNDHLSRERENAIRAQLDKLLGRFPGEGGQR